MQFFFLQTKQRTGTQGFFFPFFYLIISYFFFFLLEANKKKKELPDEEGERRGIISLPKKPFFFGFYNSNTTNNRTSTACLLALALAFCWCWCYCCFFFCISTGREGGCNRNVTQRNRIERTNERGCVVISIFPAIATTTISSLSNPKKTKKKGSDPHPQSKFSLGLAFFWLFGNLPPLPPLFRLYMAWHNS